MTVLHKGKNEILFSYETPVAVYDDKYGMFFRTEHKYSRTTSKHINKWIGNLRHETVPQITIEEYLR